VKTVIRLLMLTVALIAPRATARASRLSSGLFNGVSAAIKGLGSFVKNGARTTLAAGVPSTAWPIHLAAPGGAAVMATLVTAQLAGKPLVALGSVVRSG
jgi:hypothetical protein